MEYLKTLGLTETDIYTKNGNNLIKASSIMRLIGIRDKSVFFDRFRHGICEKYDYIKYPDDFQKHPGTGEFLVYEKHFLRIIIESKGKGGQDLQEILIRLLMSDNYSKIKPKMSTRAKRAITRFLQFLIKLIN